MVNNIERINNTKFSSKKINICISYGDCDAEEDQMGNVVLHLQKLMQQNANINFSISTIETGENEFIKGNKYGVSLHSLQHLCDVGILIFPAAHHNIVKDYIRFTFFHTIGKSPNRNLLFITEYSAVEDVISKITAYFNQKSFIEDEKIIKEDEIKITQIQEGEMQLEGVFQVRKIVKQIKNFLEDNKPELTIDKVFYQGFEVYPNEFFWHYYVKNPKIIIKKKVKISEINAGFVIY
jgi:hypothetical protein